MNLVVRSNGENFTFEDVTSSVDEGVLTIWRDDKAVANFAFGRWDSVVETQPESKLDLNKVITDLQALTKRVWELEQAKTLPQIDPNIFPQIPSQPWIVYNHPVAYDSTVVD